MSDLPCPPEDELLAFASGGAPEAVRTRIVGHLAGCDECREVTSELSKARLGVAPTETPDPRHSAPPPYERPPVLVFDPGETISGKFRVVRVLGQGGMGVVVDAEHLMLGKRVALKFMSPKLAEDSEAVARFVREARAAARLVSPHVVSVLDVATLDDGTPYIVMERLVGCDLATLLERGGALEPSLAVGYVLEAMEALAEAHAAGIVHRDLKPANLFLAEQKSGSSIVKVLDFGIAKSDDGALGGGVTTSRTVLGSPRYMAPEQMQSSKAADMRADVWALGTILFELVSGKPAFGGETLAALSVAVCAGPIPSLADAAPNAPRALVEAVAGCLERRVEARFSDVGVLARALSSVAPASAAASLATIEAAFPGRAEARSIAPTEEASRVSTDRPGGARKYWIGMVFILAIGLGAAGVWGFGRARATHGEPGAGLASGVASGAASLVLVPTPTPSVAPTSEPSAAQPEPAPSVAKVRSNASAKPGVAGPTSSPPVPPAPSRPPSAAPHPTPSSPYDERR